MTPVAICLRSCHRNAIFLANFKITFRYFSYTSCRKQSLAPLNYINGHRAYPSGLGSFDLQEPATGKTLGTVKCSGDKDVDEAVSAAGAAFEKWSALSGIERGKVLRRAADIVRQRQDEIAKWDSVDTGRYGGIGVSGVITSATTTTLVNLLHNHDIAILIHFYVVTFLYHDCISPVTSMTMISSLLHLSDIDSTMFH